MVFPTGVGMNRDKGALLALGLSVPHGRGDEPNRVLRLTLDLECSPRAWG